MKLTAKSTIRDAIVTVSGALDSAGIRAVLVGGACATIYSGGTYQSEDVDLILSSAPTQRELDDAMAAVGFARRNAQYFHDQSDVFVEFPRGPLAIGQDLDVTPVRLKVGRSHIPALSATDSCRDRLAAFYHWNDRPSLDVAVAIALRHRINLKVVREWSEGEGASRRFEEFQKELARKRRRKRQPDPAKRGRQSK